MPSSPASEPVKQSPDDCASHVGSLSKRTLDVSDIGVEEQARHPFESHLDAGVPQTYPRKRYKLDPGDKVSSASCGISLSPEAHLHEMHNIALKSQTQPGGPTLEHHDTLLGVTSGVSAQRALPRLPSIPFGPQLGAAHPPPPFAPYCAWTSALDIHGGANGPPWHDAEMCHGISFRGQSVKPVLSLDFEKGLFMSGDKVWTMYRRNYFAVRASFCVVGPGLDRYPEGEISISVGGQERPVRGFKLRLRAEIDEGQPVKLVQHTARRDKDPAFLPTLFPITPSTPLFLSQHGLPSTVQWERCQFMTATKGNGKRASEQQYFYAVVELLAKISAKQTDSEAVCIARRKSHIFVVRGRSPSRYDNEGPHTVRSGPLCSMPPPPPSQSPQFRQTLERTDYTPPPPPVTNMATWVSTKSDHQCTGNSSSGRGLSNESAFTVQVAPSPNGLTDNEQPLQPKNNTAHLLEFVASFLCLRDLAKLCMDCFALSTSKRCELQFRQLLRSFGSSLATEAKSELEQGAARAFRRSVNVIAARIMDECQAKTMTLDTLISGPLAPDLSASCGSGFLGVHGPANRELAGLSEGSRQFLSIFSPRSDTRLLIHASLHDGPVDGDEQGRTPLVFMIDFVSNSDALEDFREELLDLRTSRELARKKNKIRPEPPPPPPPYPEMVPVTSLASTVSTLM